MALNPDIIEAVANSNFKTNAEMATQNSVNHQHRLQILAEKALSKSLESMDTTSVPEGLGLAAAQRSDLAKVIDDLAAAIATMKAFVPTPGG